MYQLLILLLGCVLCSSQELTASIRLVEDATVVLQLSNDSPYGVALLRWNLPLDDRFESDSFRVLYQGEPVMYIGRRVKYAAPAISDYVFFQPSETKEFTVRLENAYDFSKQGDYDVVFTSDVVDHETDSAYHSLPHTRGVFTPLEDVISNSLKISTTKELNQKIERPFRACTSSETTQINNGYNAQRNMINRGWNRINNEGQGDRFNEWMGANNAARYETCRNCLGWVNTNTVFDFECDDMANVYAYVYPTDTTHTVYFCDAFWTAPNESGYDTKAGTIIHEISHFNDVCATNDWVYGTNGARQLAITNPARAVANADNYEYFNESPN